jgi:hypothetical protein
MAPGKDNVWALRVHVVRRRLHRIMGWRIEEGGRRKKRRRRINNATAFLLSFTLQHKELSPCHSVFTAKARLLPPHCLTE